MSRIGILGAGTWGTALAKMLVNIPHQVTVWSAIASEIEELDHNRIHPKLEGVTLPKEIRFTKDIQTACTGQDLVIVAVPSVFVRATARQAAPFLTEQQIVVCVAKGIEKETLFSMSEVIRDELKNNAIPVVALSGPTHAEEVARDIPSTIVSASENLAAAEKVQDEFMNTCMRVYTNPDIQGVELCGAVKNIIALASGILMGIGYGDNARAALITRGMAEISRLGRAMGCKEHTFYGLAGIGDLIVTATSEHSRNFRCGRLIGQGIPADQAVQSIGMVVEGINALPAALILGKKYHVELPIIEAVDAVISNRCTPRDAVDILMQREKKTE